MADAMTPPVLTVAVGMPSPEELAAVVVVLGARAGQADATTVAPASRFVWSARSRLMRVPLAAGPGAWRASGLPR